MSEVLRALTMLDEDSKQLLRLLCFVPPLDNATISEITRGRRDIPAASLFSALAHLPSEPPVKRGPR